MGTIAINTSQIAIVLCELGLRVWNWMSHAAIFNSNMTDSFAMSMFHRIKPFSHISVAVFLKIGICIMLQGPSPFKTWICLFTSLTVHRASLCIRSLDIKRHASLEMNASSSFSPPAKQSEDIIAAQ